MCYDFTLYIGCGHDRSSLYFRQLPQTKKCLCKAFKRLEPHDGLCPDCDRNVKINRGAEVPPDPLAPENRAKARAWREFLDREVKDHEAKRGTKDYNDVGGSKQKRNSESGHKQRYQSRQKFNSSSTATVVPPYVPQPGETFVQHITAEIVDDAKSGGEMTRLLQALETGVQGFGWIGEDGQESWLMLSGDWMEKNGDKMNIWTGRVGEPGIKVMSVGGPEYENFFPALGKPTIGNPAIGIPMMPAGTALDSFQRSLQHRNVMAANGWLGVPGGQPQLPLVRYGNGHNGNGGVFASATEDKENYISNHQATTDPSHSQISTAVAENSAVAEATGGIEVGSYPASSPSPSPIGGVALNIGPLE
ncbi:hypothetical protein DRE_04162 [Drechslerella stenobrocha 248]|uniref:Uncharacterized protein n=1 Tax=Drechslerella stenobrocha 248 TaxID=1043628 RepID=W7IC56_9PEZI|nr:hypothetical protein DRE_04162 [Drechslerella stenobrocha 248]